MFFRRVQIVFIYLVLGVCLFSFLLSQVLRRPVSLTTPNLLSNLNVRNFTNISHATSSGEKQLQLEEFKYLDIHVRLTSSIFRASLEGKTNQAEFPSFLGHGKYPCFYEEDDVKFFTPLLGFKPPTGKKNTSRNIR